MQHVSLVFTKPKSQSRAMLKVVLVALVSALVCGAPTITQDDSVDWRTQGVVPPVNTQGECGSSYLVALLSAVESHFAIKTGKLVKLSMQNLIDCVGTSQPGCKGGIEDLAKYADYLATVGIDTEECYPTTREPTTCQFKPSCSVGKIKGIKQIEPNEKALTAAIREAPVIVNIDGSQWAFQLYTHGVFSDKGCSSTMLDHAMVADGFGSTGSEKYYIAQNSWGTAWGEKGYILMSRDNGNNCGIATQAYAIY